MVNLLYHDTAVETAASYAVHHAQQTLVHLLRELRIEREDADWRGKLAPFAPVWAAMIAAAAAGHRTIADAERADSAQRGSAA
jgi:hypothetical protein